jgi:hypothetical protein
LNEIEEREQQDDTRTGADIPLNSIRPEKCETGEDFERAVLILDNISLLLKIKDYQFMRTRLLNVFPLEELI